MTNLASNINRWTYKEDTIRAETETRQQIYAFFLEVLQKANTSLEKELLQRIQNDNSLSIDQLMYMGADLSNLRASLGSIYNFVSNELKNQDSIDIFSIQNEKNIPTEVKFSTDTLFETVNKLYKLDLSKFNESWIEITKLSEKYKSIESQKQSSIRISNKRATRNSTNNPLDIQSFVGLVYRAQINKGISRKLQAIMFMYIEQELIVGLKVLISHLNSKVKALNISPNDFPKIKTRNILAQNNVVYEANDEELFNTLCSLLKEFDPNQKPDNLEKSGNAENNQLNNLDNDIADNGSNVMDNGTKSSSYYKDINIGDTCIWINDQNKPIKLKLSWISPISMKYLFVNELGNRTLVGTINELDELYRNGRLFPADKE